MSINANANKNPLQNFFQAFWSFLFFFPTQNSTSVLSICQAMMMMMMMLLNDPKRERNGTMPG
jgi:hypothetical protein